MSPTVLNERFDGSTGPSVSLGSRCVVTAATLGDAAALDVMLGSLFAYGDMAGIPTVVFTGDDDCARIAAKYGATTLPAAPLHAAARLVDAEQFVCIGARARVTGSIEPLFAALEVLPADTALVRDDTLYAASRNALLALDAAMQPDVIFEDAVSRHGRVVPLGDRCPVRAQDGSERPTAKPLLGPTPGDGYAQFLTALRAWTGTYGLDGLAWSFYSSVANQSAHVRDTSVLPLLATLHYLFRSQGCVRVLETGTARGVSTACIASALMHRDGGRVVTLDPATYEGRYALWDVLPPEMRACIEERRVPSTDGMLAALAAGERYEGALLDSLHDEEYVWAEFDLVRQLVCPGGLILIHDPTLPLGTVEGALRRIERAGYSVARLWCADAAVQEDDRLGLAVIENRSRADWRGAPGDRRPSGNWSLTCTRSGRDQEMSLHHYDGWTWIESPEFDGAPLATHSNVLIEATVSGSAAAAGISAGPFKDFLVPLYGPDRPRLLQVEADRDAGMWAFRADGIIVGRQWCDAAIHSVDDLLQGTLTLKAHEAGSVAFRDLTLRLLASSCRVTVVLTCYRFARRLRSVLRNWCNQSLPSGALEVIVVNPGSPDATHDVIAAAAREHPGVRIRELQADAQLWKNKGALINQAIAQSHGEWIWLSDADCLFPPNAAADALASADRAALLYCVRQHLTEEATEAVLDGSRDGVADFTALTEETRPDADDWPWGYCQFFHRSVFDETRYRDDVETFSTSDAQFIEDCRSRGILPLRIAGVTCLHLVHPFAWQGTDLLL